MIEENKYCNNVMKKHFKKELLMTNKDKEDFENFTKCQTNDYVDAHVKVIDSCHITGRYTGSAHRDCNINVKLNHKISVVVHNLKNYGSHLIMQELHKFNFKTNSMPDGLENCMTFSINNKLSFIYSFQFLNSSLDSLVKN